MVRSRPAGTSRLQASSAGAQVASLRQVTRAYVTLMPTADRRPFDELRAGECFCSIPDGSLVDRAGFPARTGRAATRLKFKPHDGRVQLTCDVAIVHARTT